VNISSCWRSRKSRNAQKDMSTHSLDIDNFLLRPLIYEDFFMPSTAVSANRVNTGTCPHGMSPGACPVCSGMAGGNSTTKRDIPRNIGEMTYNQCAAIGAMLRAQKHAREQAKLAQQNHLQALVDFQKNIASTHQRIVQMQSFLNENFPPVIAKPVNFVLNNVIRVLNFVQNLPQTLAAAFQKFAEISDKLAAIYGEFKAAVSEKVSKFLSDFRKKLKKLFFVFGTSETDDEEQKVEEAKRAFELKTLLQKITGKLNNNKKKGQKDEH